MQALKYEGRRLRMMASLVRGNDVLDLGFAQSPNELLAPYRAVGVDLQLPPVTPVGYAEQIQADVMTLADHLGGRRFDTVLCGELIEHLEQPYDFLRGLRDVVTPGGRLVLSTPNPLGFPVVLFEFARSHRRFYTADHRFYFTPRWVDRMLDDTGWVRRETLGVGLWLPLGIVPPCPITVSYQVIYVADRA
jgi:SAM-dependent methyltransferase